MTFLKFKLRNNLLSSEASIRIKHLLCKGNDLKKRTECLALTIHFGMPIGSLIYLDNIYVDTLNGSKNQSSISILNLCFKNVEKYLFIDLSYVSRIILANVCFPSHNLKTEKGRHAHIESEYRFCLFCLEHNAYSIENEFHFLMVCPPYEELRNILAFSCTGGVYVMLIRRYQTIIAASNIFIDVFAIICS